MASFIRHSSFVIFLVLVPVILSQDSSPSPVPAAAYSSPISSQPSTSEFYSPPSPPPTESPPPTTSPFPAPSPSESHTPSPSPGFADLSHAGLLDDNSSGGGRSEGLSSGRKAGFAFAAIVFSVVVIFGGIVYKKRRKNIRRQQYAFSGRWRSGSGDSIEAG